MDEDEILNARQVAEQNPELDATRRQLFGENYLQDIDQGTGIAQYYTGFGQMPTLDYTPPVVEEAAPVVDVTQPIVDTGGGGGDAGLSTGGDDDIDYSQNPLTQMITTPTGDTMTVKEAITTDQIYSPMSGGVTGDPIEVEDLTTPSNIGDFTITAAGDLPDQTGTISGEPVIGDFDEPTIGQISNNRLNEVIGGQPMAAGPFDYLQEQTPLSQVQVDGGLSTIDEERLPNYTPSFETPEQTNAINEAFNSVKDLGAAGVDKLRDSLVALGGKVKEGFDNTIEIGGKTIDLGKSLVGGAISLATGIPGIGFALNAIQSDPVDAATKTGLQEKGYGFDDIGRLTDGPMAGYSVESGFGDGIADATLDRIDNIENRDAPQTEDSIETVQELYDFLGDVTTVKAEKFGPQEDVGAISGDYGAALDDTSSAADISQDLASQQTTSNVGGGNVMDEFGSGGDTQATTGATVSTSNPDYGQFGRAQQNATAGGGGGGGGKIVCTMMNNSYGFGSFRNKIWLKHSKDLAPEYQIGYHKIFLPLVKLSKTNKVLKKTLEHIAIHRTIDIRQEARGKVHLLGRVYRKILEPICYLVGKYVK